MPVILSKAVCAHTEVYEVRGTGQVLSANNSFIFCWKGKNSSRVAARIKESSNYKNFNLLHQRNVCFILFSRVINSTNFKLISRKKATLLFYFVALNYEFLSITDYKM